MKFVLASLLTAFSFSTFAADAVPAGSYAIDTAHSKIGFEIPHLVISTVEGRFNKFDGTILVDPKLEKSKVNLSIDVSSVDTGNGDRDTHLKSPDFFDAAKSPKINFVSKKISGTTDDLKVTGDLTIKGVTKEVTLDGKYLGTVTDPYGNNKIVFTASTKINRKDFNLTWSKVVEAGPVVGDQAELKFRIEANKPSATAKK